MKIFFTVVLRIICTMTIVFFSSLLRAVILFRDVEHSGTSSACGISSTDSGIESHERFIQFRNQLKSFEEFRNQSTLIPRRALEFLLFLESLV